MKTRRMILTLLALAICFLTFQSISAAEEKLEFRQSSGIKEILIQFTGKKVSVILDSGGEMGGTITKVGDHLVHLSKLTGREYFDAVIRIDRINSVIIRVKTDR